LTLGVAIADTAGDGQSEVIIGLDDGSGRVIARVPSSTQGVSDPLDVGTLWSGSSDNGLGEIIVSGDSDGDGAEDILVSEIYSNNGAGTVWLIQGDAGAGSVSQVASASISGHLSNENAGKSVALGDVNGDGSPDIVVGAVYTVVVDGWEGAASGFNISAFCDGGQTPVDTSPPEDSTPSDSPPDTDRETRLDTGSDAILPGQKMPLQQLGCCSDETTSSTDATNVLPGEAVPLDQRGCGGAGAVFLMVTSLGLRRRQKH
jgi:hypothetical protein